MRPVTLDAARGADQSVDARVAPQGTLARVENMRVDKLGRLVLRNGYQPLGTNIQMNTGNALVPFDLHVLDDALLALGNSNVALQSGIRGVYKYQPAAGSPWRYEVGNAGTALDNTAQFLSLTPCDNVQIITGELTADTTNVVTSDCAVSTDGAFVCYVQSSAISVSVVIIDTSTGYSTFKSSFASTCGRVLYLGTVFVIFGGTGANISARTKDPAAPNGLFNVLGNLTTTATASPNGYDVAAFEDTTDMLLAYPTATGYTWRRFNIAGVQQTTTDVVSLANAPVSICGATGETISVVNVRTASGFELRTFNAVTGVLAVGPTNLDTTGTVFEWVGICRSSATEVFATAIRSATSRLRVSAFATTAAHTLTSITPEANVVQATKPIFVDGRVFSWQTIGLAAARPYALLAHGRQGTSGSALLCTTVFDGGARVTMTAAVVGFKAQIARKGKTSLYYATLVTLDPRDKAHRVQLVSFELFSGKRRQSAVVGGQLYLTGGTLTQYDGRVGPEVGFEVQPTISAVAQNGAGSMTLLGVYQYVVVYRAVAANGDVTQGTPSAPFTFTLTGGNQAAAVTYTTAYGNRTTSELSAAGAEIYYDLYRTEASGSIPRLIMSQQFVPGTLGDFGNFLDNNADSVVQVGALLYTQGADGAVSGRLSLGFAGPCGVIAESDGKILIGKLPRPNELQLSIEKHPGEAVGFVNDDIFFISNPADVTAVVAGKDGRRQVFGKSTIRELLGTGPNSAGIGDISEPVEIELRAGAVDWRSLCKTEHGIFFQASAGADPRIYLLPDGGSVAIDASEGIRDFLKLFPVITSASRHDDDQLVTFTLQNNAGTDGRILHLDLKSSGMGKSGWQGRWIIDRNPALEGPGTIEVVVEQIDVFTVNGSGSQLFDVPRGGRVGDRRVIVISYQKAAAIGAPATPAGYTARASNTTGTANQSFVSEQLLTTAALAGATAGSFAFTASISTLVIVKQYLLRGAHASQALEATQVTVAAGTAIALPTLTPTWGSARNLWLAICNPSTTFADPSFPIVNALPTSFAVPSRFAQGISGVTGEFVACQRQLEASALAGVSFTLATAVATLGWLLAVRPLANTTTPVRASVNYQGALVCCTAADVYRVTSGSFADGSSAIKGEIEYADIYPMGPNGAGRHLAISLIGELLGFCQLYASLSYDGGLTWTDTRQFQLTSVFGFQVGQVVKLQWVPKRRKIGGVRLKLVMGDEAASAAGPTAALAINQVTLWFEDLAAPVRATGGAGLGNSRH